MAENADKNTSTKKTEDPEEVAAREAGDQAPEVVEADKKVLRANAKAEKEASKDDDGEEVDPAVHTPKTVGKQRKG